jgi:DNA modification methylase
MQKTQDRVENILTSYLCEIERTIEKQNTHASKEKYIGNLNSEDIRNTLQSITWSFTDNNTTYLSHDIHPYPAKFIPQLPEVLIKLFSKYGDVIWDPFGGSGTTALEALLCNRQAISTDINPIGELIGKAKTTMLKENDEQEIESFISLISLYASNEQYFKDYVANHKKEISMQIPAIPNLSKWFSVAVTCELGF